MIRERQREIDPETKQTFYEGLILLIMVLAFLLFVAFWVSTRIAAADAPPSSPFKETLHLDAAERDALYAEMTLDPSAWKLGQRISNKPLAVVTYWNEQDKQKAAIIKVWTGFVTRDNADLLTFWDEIWVDSTGKVTLHATDNDGLVKQYFQAKDQTAFQTKEWLGIMPWAANIPTDPEALAGKLTPVPSDGSFNLYGIAFQNEISLSSTPLAIKLNESIPIVSTQIVIPSDSIHHWASKYIEDLLQRGVIKGFADGTIRPQISLTRAEFAVLLSGALQTQPIDWTDNSESTEQGLGTYADLAGHWSEQRIKGLIQDGILEKSQNEHVDFLPERAITRIEMIEWLAAILEKGNPPVSTTELEYNRCS